MGLEFGNIESAIAIDDEIVITGHQYVALAFDRDDPYIITRLIGVSTDNLKAEVVDLIATAADIYDVEVAKINDKQHIKMLIGDEKPLLILLDTIKTEYRYYRPNEIDMIFSWLPSSCSAEELLGYLNALEAHGICYIKQADTYKFSFK